MSDVAVIIRLCYFPGDDELYRARMTFFTQRVLPSLRAQTHPIDTWVWVHQRHELEARAAAAHFNVFTVDLEAPSLEFEGTLIRGYAWQAVQGLPRYPYQVLMGSDDFIAPTFVQSSIDELALDTGRARSAIATHRPIALDTRTDKVYEMPLRGRPSPFVVLRQRITDPRYTWVWARAHNHLHKIVDRTIYLPAGQAVMGINDHNDGTHIRRRAQELERPAWLDG